MTYSLNSEKILLTEHSDIFQLIRGRNIEKINTLNFFYF